MDAAAYDTLTGTQYMKHSHLLAMRCKAFQQAAALSYFLSLTHCWPLGVFLANTLCLELG